MQSLGLRARRAALLAGFCVFLTSPSSATASDLADLTVQVEKVKEDDRGMSVNLGKGKVDRRQAIQEAQAAQALRSPLEQLRDKLVVQREKAKLVKNVKLPRADEEMGDAMRLEASLHQYVVQVIQHLDSMELHANMTISEATRLLDKASVKLDLLKTLEVTIHKQLTQAKALETKGVSLQAQAEETLRKANDELKEDVAVRASADMALQNAKDLKAVADTKMVAAEKLKAEGAKEMKDGTYLKVIGEQEMSDANVAAEGLLTDEKSNTLIRRDFSELKEASKDKQKADSFMAHADLAQSRSEDAARKVVDTQTMLQESTSDLKLRLKEATAAQASAERWAMWLLILCLILLLVSRCFWDENQKLQMQVQEKARLLG